jgi:hypothetical protein
MQYRADPKNGNKLSALGFGCMRFPKDSALTEELILTAVREGVNYFDTAHLYIGSEAALGGVIKKHGLRDKVFIATKLPHFRCKTYEDFDRFLGESLERLQMDYIDYYLIHNIGSLKAWERLVELGIKDWIASKKEAKIIKNIGFSFHGKSVDFVPLLDAYNWEFCLIQYNYMNENYQAGTAGLKAICERGLPAMIMEPLLGGKLAQKLPLDAKKLFDKTALEIGAKGRSDAEWAFRWLWDKHEVTVVLSGMNAMEQLTQNIKTAANTPANSLLDEERAVYKKVEGAIEKAYKVLCSGCDYCMPCPRGVNIPAAFSAYNMSYVMGWRAGMGLYVNSTLGFGGKSASAANCNKCNACLPKCPQDIPIPTRLRQVRKRMEPLPVRLLLKAARRFIGGKKE